MCARVVVLFVLVSHMIISRCVIVNKTIISKTKIELSPLLITGKLGDIIVLSVPMVDNTLYYLYKPNGDVEELQLNRSIIADNMASHERYNIAIKEITPVNKYRIFNLNSPRYCTHNVQENEEDMINNVMIGPLVDSDHGNWVLSAYKNVSEWIEFFQVITIEIIETIPTAPPRPVLYPGEDLYLRFAYPLQHLESCEIVAPRSTVDRFYDRDKLFLDSCGFLIPNVTREDEGLWKIIGVGKIVYEANIFLQIKNNVT